MSVEVHDADPLVGKKLGDYVIEAMVGVGGMGLVYRAVHPLIGRKVAVKVLRPEMASDPEQVERFLAEARALSAVKHRGVIDVISFGHLDDGRQYMVMEFLDGEALDAVLEREGSLSPVRAVSLVDEVLDALSAAHKAGVVHRDIKPSNVFLLQQTNGTRVVKVVDFGLARRAALADLSRTGDKASLRAGTPEYMSPEQIQGLAATPRSDLYSTGVMLFELLSGRLPFEEREVVPLIEAHLRKAPPRLETLVGGLPDELPALVAQLLEKRPEDRPRSADVTRSALGRVLRDLREQDTQVTGRARARAEAGAPPDARRVNLVKVAAADSGGPTDVLPQPKATSSSVTEVSKRSADTERVPARTSRLVLGAVALGVALLLGGGVVALTHRGPEAAGLAAPPPEPAPAPVAATPLPAPPPEEQEPAPAPAQAPGPSPATTVSVPTSSPAGASTKRRAPPRAAPPSVCAQEDWRVALRAQIATGEKDARSSGRFTTQASDALRAVYLESKESTVACATLEARLRKWRAQHLTP